MNSKLHKYNHSIDNDGYHLCQFCKKQLTKHERCSTCQRKLLKATSKKEQADEISKKT